MTITTSRVPIERTVNTTPTMTMTAASASTADAFRAKRRSSHEGRVARSTPRPGTTRRYSRFARNAAYDRNLGHGPRSATYPPVVEHAVREGWRQILERDLAAL